ncbi:MAG: UDP-N-acetylmuramoyl-tripeptide--D-alanyl-D-alanine ligase [Micrococcaceae bacterium]
MIELNAAQIADATGGRLAADPKIVVTSATTDSREATADTLFLAKPGEHADGHDFIDAARSAGAALVLSQRPTDAPHILVDDVVTAMGLLAADVVRRIRAHSPTTVIGITGSAGKTTTKDLLAALLSTQGPTIAPRGSYNGEVGVPLTVFRASLDTRYLIVEMGADHVGNIAELAEMVRPDIGVVLMVGSAHAGSFGGVDNIARTKGELVEALPADGVAILNRDDAAVAAMQPRSTAPVSWFTTASLPRTPDELGTQSFLVETHDLHTDELERPVFELRLHQGGTVASAAVRSQLMGIHHASNVAAAAAAAHAAGMPTADIAEALTRTAATSAHRMARTDRADGITIIDDSYNANPESMRAGLKTLAMLGRSTGRRTWAVLGEMLELGDAHSREHILLGETVVRLNINQLVVIGDGARALYTGAVMEGSWGDEAEHVRTLEDAQALLDARLEPGDIVFLKGSHSTGVWTLADHLTASQEETK